MLESSCPVRSDRQTTGLSLPVIDNLIAESRVGGNWELSRILLICNTQFYCLYLLELINTR